MRAVTRLIAGYTLVAIPLLAIVNEQLGAGSLFVFGSLAGIGYCLLAFGYYREHIHGSPGGTS